MATVAPKATEYLTERRECPVCFATPEPLINLGEHYITDFLDTPSPNHVKAPLESLYCPECHLFMLRHVVDRDKLYRRYWYRSGTNSTMVAHLQAMAQDGIERTGLARGDVVVDIGSNDGTTLNAVPGSAITIGFEPSNIAEATVAGRHIIKPTYFSNDAYKNIMASKRANLIFSTAMFYDLPSPQKFVGDIAEIMRGDGLWILEMNYLGSMLDNNAYDFIGHEHVNLYFISTLNKVLRPEGLVITDIAFNGINGGSMRAYIRHAQGAVVSPNVGKSLYAESKGRNPLKYRDFAIKSCGIMAQIREWVATAASVGLSVYAKGASTRGMTTLQASGLDSSVIRGAIDINPAKIGKYMAGVNIPVIDEASPEADTADYKLILPWGFLEQFKTQEKDYLDNGGKLFVAFPTPTVITKGDV
ncbi:hypothetical protein CMI37_19540 [Candidatus Pacearchaeota archaeon]|nr:hypothetical protein [Candidatus Pacearchaeota archaeon]|tara:strand:+ start:2569 stop:3819 length:1251 start_codon:yes stop_codon:yes gene_type:complete